MGGTSTLDELTTKTLQWRQALRCKYPYMEFFLQEHATA